MPVTVDVARDLAQTLRLGVLAGLVGELPYVDVVRGGAADLDGARLPEDVERLLEVLRVDVRGALDGAHGAALELQDGHAHVLSLEIVVESLARRAVDLLDLVPKHPPEQIDAVDALVHESAAVLLPGPAPGRLLVIGLAAVPAHVDGAVGDGAEAALVERPPQLLDGEVEAVLVADGNLDALLAGALDDQVGVSHGHGHRLLDDHVDAALDAVEGDLGVLTALGRDAHELDLRVSVEHRGVVAAALGPGEVPAAGLLEHDVELGGVDVADGDEIQAVVGNGLDMVDRDPAAADESVFHVPSFLMRADLEGREDGGDNLVLLLLGDVGRERDAEVALSVVLGVGERLRAAASEGLHLVKGLRVVDEGGDAGLLHRGDDVVALLLGLRDEHELREGAHGVLGDLRGLDLALEGLPVAGGDFLTLGHLAVEQVHLREKDRRLDRVEARVHSDADVVVLAGALAVDLQGGEEAGDLVIVGVDGSAVAVAAERLRGEEARAGDVAERTAAGALIDRSGTLRGVLDQQEVVVGADLGNLVEAGRVAEEVDGDDSAGPELTLALDALDLLGERARREVEGVGFDVAEDRGCAEHRGGLHGGDEGHRGTEDGIARSDPIGHVRELERLGAVAATEAVGAAHVSRKPLLELAHLLAADEMGAGHDLVDLNGKGRAEQLVLLLEVDKLHYFLL